MWVKEYKFIVRKQIDSGVLMHSIVILVNNIALYTSKMPRDQNLNVFTTHTEK